MKPPQPYDQRPMLWTTGAILGTVGLVMGIVDNPLVPLTHVFHLVPIAVGGGVGTAILRERNGPPWIAAYIVFILWLVAAVIGHQTSGAPVMLAAGLFSLTRAIVQTVAEMEG